MSTIAKTKTDSGQHDIAKIRQALLSTQEALARAMNQLEQKRARCSYPGHRVNAVYGGELKDLGSPA